MLADDHTIDTLQQLVKELRTYLALQKQYARLELAEKLSILLSTLIVVLVALLLGVVVLFHLSFALAHLLAPSVGGLGTAFALIGLLILAFIFVLVLLRQRLIVQPVVRFISKLFLSSDAS